MSHDLPDGLEFARVTPDFDEATVPSGLLRAHRVADGVWGRLVVRAGVLRFVFEDAPDDGRELRAGDEQAIPPGRAHHVELCGPVRFAVEFHRIPDGTVPS